MSTEGKTGFLEEAPKVKSFVRLQSLLFTVVGLAITIYQVLANRVDVDLLLVVFSFAAGPKVIQKFAEGGFQFKSKQQ